MKCSFCSLEIKKKLGFDTLFAKKEDFYLCASCREHIDINVLGVGEYTLYYFADYEFLGRLFEGLIILNKFVSYVMLTIRKFLVVIIEKNSLNFIKEERRTGIIFYAMK